MPDAPDTDDAPGPNDRERRKTATEERTTARSDVDRAARWLPVHRSVDLELTIVQYENGPDRGTLHPPGLEGIERMETWLSADAAAFVGLREWR
jgi:hypothetical protein